MNVAVCTGYRGLAREDFRLGPLRALLASAAADSGGHRLVDGPAAADMLIFADTGEMPPPVFLWRERRYRENVRKAFFYSDEDEPWPVFPGVAPGIPQERYDPAWHRGGPYIRDGLADWVVGPLPEHPRRWLFSFCGSCETAPVRAVLKACYAASGAVLDEGRAAVQRAFETGDRERIEAMRERFAGMSAGSAFVLCPRGVAVSSIRLFEVMAMGRAPVILADGWVPPPGPDWGAFSVRVPEGEAAMLEQVLAPMRGRAEEMGARARRAWEEWFAPQVAFRRTVESCLAIRASGRTVSLAAHARRWAGCFGPAEMRAVLRYFKRALRDR